ncbi:Stem 28 kDa glycoprotein [Morus notabilis]|uniref:Stem 28 kDa glycoprotein n=1 Tax=Morus notabilis TaxID=981085 RepID=W9QFP1_9ROSA|nr:stem 28 kDa glycoprotein [Morus notabilis]XP_024026837.1 stem 28 kDa glycoprotein [Morus notabilis]EXB34861.1 Stem 28 kDa glycoprotein [Morus notabilis]
MLLFFFLASTVLAAKAQADFNNPLINNLIYLLRPRYGSGGGGNGVSCLSWRFGVETNNIIDWSTIPEKCELYVGNYMLGEQYRKDSEVVIKEAYLYATSLNLSKDGKDVWIFDIDETSLSNLPYYARHGFGVEPFNLTSFTEWILTEDAPALPETLKLYKSLISLGFKIVFLSGRYEKTRSATERNLIYVGYKAWEKVLLRKDSDKSASSLEYKSAQRKQLVKDGYSIVGNIGDQWSDLLGTDPGNRTFKLPDPMYYIS